MFDKFFPDRYVASTYVIDFEGLYKEGVRGLIFDQKTEVDWLSVLSDLQ